MTGYKCFELRMNANGRPYEIPIFPYRQADDLNYYLLAKKLLLDERGYYSLGNNINKIYIEPHRPIKDDIMIKNYLEGKSFEGTVIHS